MRWIGIGAVLLGLMSAGCSRTAKCPLEHVNVDILLSRMTNLNAFAESPLGESFLTSSYDRSGGNQDWVVYQDVSSAGRVKIFEAEGPGYISRFWIASFDADRWLFFFDGEPEPRLDLAKDDLFGEKFPFVTPLAGKSGGGRYCLLPIPFSKSLRIEMVPKDTLSANSRNYYQINYTKFDLPSSAVESFPQTLTSAQSNLVVAVNGVQRTTEEQLQPLIDFDETREITSGQAVDFWNDEGAGLLKSFCLRFDSPEPPEVMSQELLRKLRLQMFWDGNELPSVDVPLGDFFCNPFYFRKFASMPLGQLDETFVCRFPMPYQKGALCRLVNYSDVPVTVSVGAKGDAESSQGLARRFHAVWRAQNISGIPFRMMKAAGSGHYVGCFLSAIGQDGSWTILEGDEFLRPDSGKQPPQLGTGLEDYFNGAYYYTSLFDLPLHGLIEKGAMRTDQYRFHLLDTVAFQDSFEAGFEFGDQNRAKGYMSSVAYWYADQAVAVPLSSAQSYLLDRPGDRFELHGLMSQLFLLERAGLYVDAASRMEFFANRYASQPWSDRFRVRALGYREKTDGFESVRSEYELFTNSVDVAAAKAARDRLWLAENPANALLGIHALAKYSLSMDGQLIAKGEGKADLRVIRLPVVAGNHQWRIDLEPTRQGSFFSFCLQTSQGELTSAGAWAVLSSTELAGRPSPDTFEGQAVLPNMTVWAFEPNAYVGMQSPSAGIQLWSFWDSRPRIEKVSLLKDWALNDTIVSPVFSGRERSEQELRANAIE